ncbi:Pectinesterase 2 [Acorus calamus]|uniref:Pectinesterase n=1 Tax=Acorus calamus TaxID=4465 RepID=A0AAV9C9U9_ACOCL|nr:Pectinesterase 2 [Acorus calamus]
MPLPPPTHTVLSLLLLLLLTLTTSSSSCSSDHDHDHDIHTWCLRTPHPNSCLHYMGNDPPPNTTSDFFNLSVSAALSRALHAQSHLNSLRHRFSRNASESKAWSDCMSLYRNTIIQLNRSVDSPTATGCTAADKQTWLSAALTNLEICHILFGRLGLSEETVSPLQGYNVSDLISNSLAINEAPPAVNGTGEENWATVGMRRLLQTKGRRVDVVVAKDGSGKYRTIGEAIKEAERQRKRGRKRRFVIYVKAGVYSEYLQIGTGVPNLTLIGDGKGKTIIRGNRSVGKGYTMVGCATVSVFGDGFIAQDLTFRNDNGPRTQALALLLGSDRSIIYRCSIEGYQDTLCVFSQRQFYRECDIYGTIDFIFGNAAAVLQSCNIFARRPLQGQGDTITAQGRTDPNQNTGIVIQKCVITSAPDLKPVQRSVKTYLGRPWMRYSRTIYMQNYFDSLVHPAGWLEWKGNFALDTLYYAEFKNTGPGSKMSRRVRWKGFHIIVRPSLVKKFTVANFLGGGLWIHASGVPFGSGL